MDRINKDSDSDSDSFMPVRFATGLQSIKISFHTLTIIVQHNYYNGKGESIGRDNGDNTMVYYKGDIRFMHII